VFLELIAVKSTSLYEQLENVNNTIAVIKNDNLNFFIVFFIYFKNNMTEKFLSGGFICN
jgi:hypothetical protein